MNRPSVPTPNQPSGGLPSGAPAALTSPSHQQSEGSHFVHRALAGDLDGMIKHTASVWQGNAANACMTWIDATSDKISSHASDLSSIGMVAQVPNLLIVRPDLPVHVLLGVRDDALADLDAAAGAGGHFVPDTLAHPCLENLRPDRRDPRTPSRRAVQDQRRHRESRRWRAHLSRHRIG